MEPNEIMSCDWLFGMRFGCKRKFVVLERDWTRVQAWLKEKDYSLLENWGANNERR